MDQAEGDPGAPPAVDARADDAVLLGPVRRPSAGEQLADRLLTALALGAFSPGERLPSERDLAAQLQTSRATVRDAVRRLSVAGHVEVRRGRLGGAYVRQAWTGDSAAAVRRTMPDQAGADRHQDFRGLVEGLVARTAAERRGEGDAQALRKVLADFDVVQSLEQARLLDARLHRTVAAAAHNADLAALSERLQRETTLGFGLEPFSEEVLERARPQHAALVQAVLDGDGDRAAAVATGHFSLTTEALRALRRRAGA